MSFLRGSVLGSEVRFSKRYKVMGCCERTWHWANENFLKPAFGKKERLPKRDMFESVRVTVLQSVIETPQSATKYKDSVVDSQSKLINPSLESTENKAK